MFTEEINTHGSRPTRISAAVHLSTRLRADPGDRAKDENRVCVHV